MKNKILAGMLVCSLLGLQTACGASTEETSEDAAVTEEAATEETEEVETEQAELETYTSADGWTIQYDSSVFEPGEIDEHQTQFSYLLESAGANVVTISYVTDKTADEVLLEKKDSWGDVVRVSGTTMPGAEDKKGYMIQGLSSEETNGMSEDFFIGEYNGGVLVWDILTHQSGQDEIDIPVSDYISQLLYSVSYENYEDQTSYEADTIDDYLGQWAETTAERVVADIEKSEDGEGYDVEITWREDLPQKDVYTIHLDGEPENGWYYTGCTYAIRTFEDDGSYTDDVQYEDGNGSFFYCKADETLYWTDYTVGTGADSVTTFKVAAFE